MAAVLHSTDITSNSRRPTRWESTSFGRHSFILHKYSPIRSSNNSVINVNTVLFSINRFLSMPNSHQRRICQICHLCSKLLSHREKGMYNGIESKRPGT